MVEARHLTVEYKGKNSLVRAVDNIGFTIAEGSITGLAGESGCGKSSLVMALLRLIEHPNNVSGELVIDGEKMLELSKRKLRGFRWKRISVVFQSAMNSLDPVYTVRWQIAEAIKAHKKITKKELDGIIRDLLSNVRIDPEHRNDFPHELSGGMKQRVSMAMAIALKPRFLIADEPTTALDVVTQRQVLMLLKELREKHNMTVLIVSHDLSLLSEVCSNIMIMYAGKIAESGTASEIVSAPRHPYTKMLIESIPSLYGKERVLKPIPGSPPLLEMMPSGCRFHPRCPFATQECRESEPPEVRFSDTHSAACFHPTDGR